MPTRSATRPHRSPSVHHRQPVRRIRLLLVDDHALFRKGLGIALGRYATLEIVGEASDGEEALKLVDWLSPDVVVMDSHLPRLNGIEATRSMTQRHAHLCVVGLSCDMGRENREAMFKAGACILLDKGMITLQELYYAIRRTVGMNLGATHGAAWSK